MGSDFTDAEESEIVDMLIEIILDGWAAQLPAESTPLRGPSPLTPRM
jgi:hypothetical protein